MDKNSFVSCSNYFDKLRYKARQIDEGIDRLTETWKTPQLLIGGYAERTAETDGYLEELWESIRSTNDAIEKSRLELEPLLEETDQFLEESRAIYEDLKVKCDNVDIVLAEYHCENHCEEDNDSVSKNVHRNDNKNNINNSSSISDEIPDMEVEFTPNLTWKCKARSKESDISIPNQRSLATHGIATPVIKSLASVLQSEIPGAKGSLRDDIPKGESSYTKHLTKVLRK